MRFSMNKSPSTVSETWSSSDGVVFELVQLYESDLGILVKCRGSLCKSRSSEQFQWNANQTSPYEPRSNLLLSLYLKSILLPKEREPFELVPLWGRESSKPKKFATASGPLHRPISPSWWPRYKQKCLSLYFSRLPVHKCRQLNSWTR